MTTGDLPFERYIVFCQSDIEAPAYIRRNPRARYDLRPLVDDNITIRDRSSNLGRGHQPVYQFSHESEPANRVNVIKNYVEAIIKCRYRLTYMLILLLINLVVFLILKSVSIYYKVHFD
jgi:hypothetical protein